MRRLVLALGLALLVPTASSLAAAETAPGVLTGRVMRDAKTIQCVRAPCLEPAPGVKITFTRVGARRSVTTDRYGRYSATLAPAVYRVTGPGLVRQGLDAVRVRSGKRVVLNLRIGASGSTESEKPSTS